MKLFIKSIVVICITLSSIQAFAQEGKKSAFARANERFFVGMNGFTDVRLNWDSKSMFYHPEYRQTSDGYSYSFNFVFSYQNYDDDEMTQTSRPWKVGYGKPTTFYDTFYKIDFKLETDIKLNQTCVHAKIYQRNIMADKLVYEHDIFCDIIRELPTKFKRPTFAQQKAESGP